MDSPKSKDHLIVDTEMTTDPDARVESDPDIRPDSETDPKVESDPSSKADPDARTKAGANPDPPRDSDSSPAAATPRQSDIAHDQFTKSLVAFHAERGCGSRLHRSKMKLLTTFNAAHN